MYFPRYWAKGRVQGPDREGLVMDVQAWGWSDINAEDARQKGAARAEKALSRFPGIGERGRAYYDDASRPFREAVLSSTRLGEIEVVVTRNSLGCDILNSPTLAFADIDYTPLRGSFFGRLFGSDRKKESEHRTAWQSSTLERLRAWQAAHRSMAFRTYQTCGGLRLLVTSTPMEAGTPDCESWLEAVGSDPLYVKLCRNQKSFRARLTPKPWRCGCRQPPARFPYETTAQEKAMNNWLEHYRRKSESFATCQFVTTMGPDSFLPELRPAIEFHDQQTKALSGLVLA